MAEIKGYFKGRNGQLIEVVDKKARNDNEIRSVIEEDENGDFVVKQGKFSTSEEQVQVALKDDVDALSSQIANYEERIETLENSDSNSEKKSYKISKINDSNKNNEIMYPNVKAVTDYVNPLNQAFGELEDKVDEVDSRLSESIEEISKSYIGTISYDLIKGSATDATNMGRCHTSMMDISKAISFRLKSPNVGIYIGFYDDEGNSVGYYANKFDYGVQSINFSDVTLPSNATKYMLTCRYLSGANITELDDFYNNISIIDNGINVPNRLNTLEFVTMDSDKIKESVAKKTSVDITDTLTWIDGYYENGNINNFKSISEVRTSSVDIKKGETYIITGKDYYNAKLFFIFADGVTKSVYPSTGGNKLYSNVVIDVVQDGKLYVACANKDKNAFNLKKVNTEYLYIWDYIGHSDRLKGKKWYALGDSITHRDFATVGAKNYLDLIADATGVIPTNGGISGTGYMKNTSGNNNFASRSANITGNYDIITIFGSVNDITYTGASLGTKTDTGTTTLGGCINTTISNIYANIPNAHLGIISPIPNGSWAGNPARDNPSEEGHYFAKICKLLEDICLYRGIPFLNLWKCSNLRPWESAFQSAYFVDDTHPNTEGYKIFSNRIEQFIRSL